MRYAWFPFEAHGRMISLLFSLLLTDAECIHASSIIRRSLRFAANSVRLCLFVLFEFPFTLQRFLASPLAFFLNVICFLNQIDFAADLSDRALF